MLNAVLGPVREKRPPVIQNSGASSISPAEFRRIDESAREGNVNVSGMTPTTRVGDVVERDARVDDVLASAEVGSPRPIAEDHDRLGAGLAVLGTERAASQGARADAVEQSRQHRRTVHTRWNRGCP